MLSIKPEIHQGRWQKIALKIVEEAEERLWSSVGEQALDYLLHRGFISQTIRQARLGFIPGDYREWRTIEGFKISCGITIPWFIDGLLWMVKVRREAGTVKYISMEGSHHHGLYNADTICDAKPVLFCEGEFDTLRVQQEAADLVCAVTLGSPINHLPSYWMKHLYKHSSVFIAYDSDNAGERGILRLLKSCPHFQPLRLPHSNDITEFYLQNGDLRDWLQHSINMEVI